jgi:2-dehydro-3-deoxyglucarate aldolase
MLARSIKDKLQAHEPSVGSWMSMAHLSIAEILGAAGYEWVVIETEHTAIDVSEVLPLIAALEGAGTIPLVRLAWNDPIQMKAVLDSGAAGVLVPNVRSAAEARQAVVGAKYPPLGERGVGLARAQGYGRTFTGYIERANEDSLLILQVEHVDAVECIEGIVATEGIDGVFIGPYDLSMSMGLPGQIDHPDVEEAKDRVLQAALSAGIAAGVHLVHPDEAEAQLSVAISKGYTFIALGTDILFLGDACRSLFDSIKSIITVNK